MSTNKPARGAALKLVAGYLVAAPVSIGRPSASHLSKPPSSTCASTPSERSIHQNRVDHIIVPML
ncbi:hypothetical protein ACVWXO_010798 [Bradyrhizobium sp. LM2.7]